MYVFFGQIMVFEEQKTAHNVEFTSSPDYGKAEHVKWGHGEQLGTNWEATSLRRDWAATLCKSRQICSWALQADHQTSVINPD